MNEEVEVYWLGVAEVLKRVHEYSDRIRVRLSEGQNDAAHAVLSVTAMGLAEFFGDCDDHFVSDGWRQKFLTHAGVTAADVLSAQGELEPD